MTMTFGELIVAATVALSIVTAYLAIKNQLATVTSQLSDVSRIQKRHDAFLLDHDRGLEAVHAKVFGRRRTDREDAERIYAEDT